MDTKIKNIAGLNFVSDGNFHWAGATYLRLGGAGLQRVEFWTFSPTRYQ